MNNGISQNDIESESRSWGVGQLGVLKGPGRMGRGGEVAVST